MAEDTQGSRSWHPLSESGGDMAGLFLRNAAHRETILTMGRAWQSPHRDMIGII
jgi:hypothetical protein